MLSLKKAAASRGSHWSLGEPTIFTGMRFAGVRKQETTEDSITLESLGSKGHGGGRDVESHVVNGYGQEMGDEPQRGENQAEPPFASRDLPVHRQPQGELVTFWSWYPYE